MDAGDWLFLSICTGVALSVGVMVYSGEKRHNFVDDCIIEEFEESRSAPGSLRDYCEALERQS